MHPLRGLDVPLGHEAGAEFAKVGGKDRGTPGLCAPELILQEAVRRMLPKTKLGRQMFGKLRVYSGTEHPHSAQQPVKVEPK